MEIYFIKKYNSTDPSKGYNVVSGGNTTLGFKMSEEVRNKITERFIKRKKATILEGLKRPNYICAKKYKLKKVFYED